MFPGASMNNIRENQLDASLLNVSLCLVR